MSYLGCGVLVLIGLVSSCKKAAESDAANRKSPSVATAPSSERQVTAPAVKDPRDFGAMFQSEAASRPAQTVKAEAAYEAFQRSGVAIDSIRQHLAKPYGARYCVGANAGPAVAISVCEYLDAEAARAGAEMSRKIPLANREIRVNQATTLTVREVEKSAAAAATSEKLFASFAKL